MFWLFSFLIAIKFSISLRDQVILRQYIQRCNQTFVSTLNLNKILSFLKSFHKHCEEYSRPLRALTSTAKSIRVFNLVTEVTFVDKLPELKIKPQVFDLYCFRTLSVGIRIRTFREKLHVFNDKEHGNRRWRHRRIRNGLD